MKAIAVVFAFLLAGVSATPSKFMLQKINGFDYDVTPLLQERLVDGIIAEIIEGLSENIRDAGLDPYELEAWNMEYKLPVTNLLNVQIEAKGVQSTGLSEIVINDISFNILTTRLRMDVSLPRITAYADRAALDFELLGLQFNANIGGSLAIVEPRVRVDARISIGIISGISIRNLEIKFELGAIESALEVEVMGKSYSNPINKFLGTTLPEAIAANEDEINELIEYVALQLIDQLM